MPAEHACFAGIPCIVLTLPRLTLVLSPAQWAKAEPGRPDMGEGYRHGMYNLAPAVFLRCAGMRLLLHRQQFENAQVRGKAYRRWLTARAQLRRAEAREEAAQLRWLDSRTP